MEDVLIPKDFKDYEPRLIGNFTIRQTLLLVPGFILAIFFKSIFNESLFVLATMIVFALIWALGWQKFYNMKFEEFLATSFVKMFLSPQKRIYKTDNLHRVILDVDSKKVANDKVKAKKKNRRRLNVQKKRKG